MGQADKTIPAQRRGAAAECRMPLRYLDLLLGAKAASGLLERAGIDRSGLEKNGAFLPSVTFLNLCLEHMRRLDDESYGIAPERVPRGRFGLLMAAAGQADRFDDALCRFAEAAEVLRPDLRIRVLRSRGRLQLSLTSQLPRSARTEFLVEIFAVTTQCGFRWLTGRRLRPLHVRVAAPLPGFERSVLSVFKCPMPQNGTGVTIGYDPHDADAPVLPVKYQHWAAQEFGEFMRLLEEAVEDSDQPPASPCTAIVSRVSGLIAEGIHSESEAAAQLGMSTASLRRRMREAGSGFRTVLAETRRNAVSSLLITDKSLDDISLEIGFSDTRSLRRACRRWFGMTPRQYRKHLARGGPRTAPKPNGAGRSAAE